MVDYLTSSFVTLIVVADPLLLSALFMGLTAGMSDPHRREVAWRGPLIAFGILVAMGLVGERLLGFLGISLSAFRIAGGLLLLWSAWEMVFGRRYQQLEATADTAITATILLAGEAQGRPDYLVGLISVIGLVMLACLFAFLGADRISRVLGVTGRAVSTRMLGIILAALAVQFVIDGITDLGLS